MKISHLTDEQFEDVLQGGRPPEHLQHCEHCKTELAEKKALAARLRSAFAAIKPTDALTQQIRQKLIETPTAPIQVPLHRRSWPAIAAAAAILIIAIPLVMHLAAPRSAAAKEFARIHQHNLAAGNQFFSVSDPDELARFFKEKLDFSPAMPQPGQGLALRGCCVRHFRDQVVGSYVVQTPQGVISIIAVTDPPESLGMASSFTHGEHTLWRSSFAENEMVAVRLGPYSYCAVGEVSHSYLTNLLVNLVSAPAE